MRPKPPAPDTPNEGRARAYNPLVEPYEPEKLQRRDLALVGAVAGAAGSGLATAVYVILGVWT